MKWPVFNGIPRAIGLAADDCGMPQYRPQQTRNFTVDDYRTLIDVGRAAGTRIMTAWLLEAWDREGVLRRPSFNRPAAKSDLTAGGTDWRPVQTPEMLAALGLVRENAAWVEFGLHGLSHEHYPGEPGGLSSGQRAEWADVRGFYDLGLEEAALPWEREDLELRAAAWEEVMRQYFDRATSSFPRSFVPPAHGYFYGGGHPDSTGGLLAPFGVKYATGLTHVGTTLGDGGIDRGVLFVNRAIGADWWAEGRVPGDHDRLDTVSPANPYEVGWIEAHFQNFWDAGGAWTAYLRAVGDSPGRYLAKNTVQCASQWLYRKYAVITGGRGRYVIDNRLMTDDAYRHGLLGTLVLKTPLGGRHVRAASVDGGAQIVGCWEAGGYGHLVIGHATNAMGRLSKEVYTLEASLGDDPLPAHVDLKASTCNVHSFTCTGGSVWLALEVYGAQELRLRLPFEPAAVAASGEGLTAGAWSRDREGFLILPLAGRDIQGTTGAVTVEGRGGR